MQTYLSELRAFARLAVLALGASGCGPSVDSGAPVDTGRDTGSDPPLLMPTLALGTPVEAGSGLFARSVPWGGALLVGSAAAGEGYWVRGESLDLEPTGLDLVLSPADSAPSEIDHSLVAGGGALFHGAFAVLQGDDAVVLHRYDADLALESAPDPILLGNEEVGGDLSLLWADGRLWLGTEYREDGATWEGNLPPREGLERGLWLREYDADLGLVARHALTATVPEAAEPWAFWGLGAGQLRVGEHHWVLASITGTDMVSFDEGESAGTRRVWALGFDSDMAFAQATGPLSPAGVDAYWPSGAARWGDYIFVSHTFRRPEDGPVMGPGTPDVGNLGLLVLDTDLQLIGSLDLTDFTPEEIVAGGGAHRSSLTVIGDRLFVSYDTGFTPSVLPVDLGAPGTTAELPRGRPRVSRRR